MSFLVVQMAYLVLGILLFEMGTMVSFGILRVVLVCLGFGIHRMLFVEGMMEHQFGNHLVEQACLALGIRYLVIVMGMTELRLKGILRIGLVCLVMGIHHQLIEMGKFGKMAN